MCIRDSFNGFWQSRWKEFYKDLKRLNVMGGEMETSIVLVLTRIWGLRGGAMAVTLDNIIGSQEEEGNYCLLYTSHVPVHFR